MTHSVKPGMILVANPHMDDPVFGRSVILMVASNENGCAGINVAAVEPISEEKLGACSIYIGGPVVSPPGSMLLHEAEADSVAKLGDTGYAVSTVRDGAETGLVDKEGSAIYIGYAGWDHNRLTAEMDGGFWTVSCISLRELLSEPPSKRWERARENR